MKSITALKTEAYQLTQATSLQQIKNYALELGLVKMDFRKKSNWEILIDAIYVDEARLTKKTKDQAIAELTNSGVRVYSENFVGNYSAKLSRTKSVVFNELQQLWLLYICNANRPVKTAKNLSELGLA